MYCIRCGKKIEDQSKFCKYCGTKIDNTHEAQYQYNLQYSDITEESLEKAYIGSNYEQIKNEKFSIPAFFLGFYYMLYRKMWLLAFLYFAVTITVGILSIYNILYAPLLSLFLIIIVSINFNKIYIHTVSKRVDKIKKVNNQKTNQELVEICKKKGGVSVIAVVISIIMIILLSIVLMIIIISSISMKLHDFQTDKKNLGIKIQYQIPEGFQEQYNKTSYANYKYDDENNSCSFSIVKYGNYSNESAEEYLKEHTYTTMNDQVSEIKSSVINNSEWKYLEIQKPYSKSFHYVNVVQSDIYKIEYIIYKDNKICSEGYNKFINSLKIIEDDKQSDIDHI